MEIPNNSLLLIPEEIKPVPSLKEICAQTLGKYAKFIIDLDYINESSIDLICKYSDEIGLFNIENLIHEKYADIQIDFEKHWKNLYFKENMQNNALSRFYEKYLYKSDSKFYKNAIVNGRFFNFYGMHEFPKDLLDLILRNCEAINYVRKIDVQYKNHLNIIQKFPNLYKITLRKVSPEFIDILINGLNNQCWKNLQKLTISNSEIPIEIIIKLIQIIRKTQSNHKLIYLNLRFNNLTTDVLSEIFEYYKEYKEKATIRKIKLQQNFFGPSIKTAQKMIKEIDKFCIENGIITPVIKYI